MQLKELDYNKSMNKRLLIAHVVDVACWFTLGLILGIFVF